MWPEDKLTKVPPPKAVMYFFSFSLNFGFRRHFKRVSYDFHHASHDASLPRI